MKLNMDKIYDKVECNFLKVRIMKMIFHVHYINLLMGCVTSISYSILLNGEPKQSFSPTRRLRQGDLLFPYIFII